MESINHALFLWINASAQPPLALLALARFLAETLVFGLPALFALLWLRGRRRCRDALVESALAALLALSLGAVIGLLWPQPRPFALGLGHRYIAHVADASFPSDHLTLFWSIALNWMLQRTMTRVGIALALTGIGVAWARIYVGVHFPLDMLGALGVAVCGAYAAHTMRGPLRAMQNRLEAVRERLLRAAITAGLAAR